MVVFSSLNSFIYFFIFIFFAFWFLVSIYFFFKLEPRFSSSFCILVFYYQCFGPFLLNFKFFCNMYIFDELGDPYELVFSICSIFSERFLFDFVILFFSFFNFIHFYFDIFGIMLCFWVIFLFFYYPRK